MKALRREISTRARQPVYLAGSGALAAAALMALYGLWGAAVACALIGVGLLWLASALVWPFGEGAHWRRVTVVITDANTAMRQATAVAVREAREVLAALQNLPAPARLEQYHREMTRAIHARDDLAGAGVVERTAASVEVRIAARRLVESAAAATEEVYAERAARLWERALVAAARAEASVLAITADEVRRLRKMSPPA